jgi:hypothetical protein
LKSHKVTYTEHEYDYVERGGTEVSAAPQDISRTLNPQLVDVALEE